MIVCWGVDSFGVVGPNTAIELAQNILLIFSSTQRSNNCFVAIRLTYQAKSGFCSPSTDNNAAKW
jgi:hypothetical protein